MKENSTSKVQEMASENFVRRFLAYIIDMALCFGLLYLMKITIGDEEMFDSDRADMTKNIIFSAYMFLALLLSGGRSLGKRIAGLRVERMDGEKPGVFDLLYREFVGRFLIEKSNLVIYYVLTVTGALEKIRSLVTHPIADTFLVAAITLPWLTFVSFAFALCRPDGRVLHDLTSGMRVVRT